MTPEDYKIYKKKWDQAHWLPNEERQKRQQEKQSALHNV